MKVIAVLLILQFVCSCNSTEERIPVGTEYIEDKIRQDINDGLSQPIRISIPDSIDASKLPRKKYAAEPQHSSIQFRTGHWEIVDLIGWFRQFEIVMYSDRLDFTDAVIFAQLNPGTILMPNEKMMESLQNEEYLDTKKHPFITFASKSISLQNENKYQLTGDIELKGIKKEIVLDVHFNGFAYPGEQSICGFSVNGSVNRNDFGFGGDHSLHSGRKIHDELIYFTANLRME